MTAWTHAGAALLTLAAAAPALGDGTGTPGFLLDAPTEVVIGTQFDFCVTTPVGNTTWLLFSFDPGPTPSIFGPLCVGDPLFATLLGPQQQTTDCYTIPVDCRDLFVGAVAYAQVVSLDPTNPANSGVTDGVAITGLDGPCGDPCLGELSGCVYQDFDGDGELDDDELPVAGVDVVIFDENENVLATLVTDADGKWFAGGLLDTNPLRLEFSGYPAWLAEGAETGGGRAVQFTDGDACEYDLGLIAPAELCLEDADACLATPCYVSGDPLAGGDAGVLDVMVRFPYDASGFGQNEYLAAGMDMGSTWGLAYQQSTDRLFAATFLKRHVGFGPGGIGAIYAVDGACFADEGATPTSVWLDVNSLPGVDVGTLNRPDLGPNSTDLSFDTEAYGGVGKLGLGGLAISEDERTLYVVNLFQRTVLAIDIDSKTLVAEYPVDIGLDCVGGVARPFAVNYFRGELYVGVTCTAELDPFAGVREARVRRLDNGVFTDVLTIPLDYTRERAAASCPVSGWFPWFDVFSAVCNPQAVLPQPMLSSVEFGVDGCVALGFIDRHGHQTGFLNYTPTSTDLFEGISAGELLRACVLDDGSWLLEDDGSIGGVTTAGQGNDEGPGGGEFFFGDAFQLNGNTAHFEVTLGGVVVLPNSREVATTAFDPIDEQPGEVRTGGVRRLSTDTGDFVDAYRVYSLGDPGTFGKAAGLGDLALLCSAPPIVIGDRLFRDDDGDGLQTATDPGIAGVEVQLFRDNLLVDTTTTDDDGRWSFAGLVPNVPVGYEVRIDRSQPQLLGFTATTAGVGTNPGVDSNGDVSFVPGSITVLVPTGAPGANDFSLDVGVVLQDV